MDWIPSLSTTAGFALILWLCRNIIAERLKNAVKHEYDVKLEDLKTKIRLNEEAFKADLQAKESQIESLRTSVLSNVTLRQDIVFEKQVKAIDHVWEAVRNIQKGKQIAITISVLKFEAALEEAEKNPRMREFADIIGQGIDFNSFDTDPAQKARPYISLLAWAYYSAYQAIIFHALTKLHLLKTGIYIEGIVENEKIVELVKTALPHYIDKHGPGAFHFFLDELETCMLSAFRLMLKGEELDHETVERTNSIIKQADKLKADDQKEKIEEDAS